MDYLLAHWRGQQSLAQSFWINFALLFLMISVLVQLICLASVERITTFALLAGAYLFFGCLIVYPWQMIGLMRACDRYLAENRNIGWTKAVQRVTAIQGAMVASLVVIVVTWFALLQNGLQLNAASHHTTTVTDDRAYTIEIVEDRDLILIDGEFAPGLSKYLKQLLDNHGDMKGVVLNSDGGRVYEARGVAKIIDERQLETYVFNACRSACTTAFIAGSRRYLGEGGRLGFHQYLLQSVLPKIDVAAEQEKDLTFFRAKGVELIFLEKLFNTPHDSMWYPDVEDLLQSNVIHELIRAEER